MLLLFYFTHIVILVVLVTVFFFIIAGAFLTANFVHEKLPATSYELIIAIQAFETCHGNSTKPRTNPNKFAPRADKRESSAGSSSSGLGSEKNDCVSSISHMY